MDGWKCPVCNKGVAPHIDTCDHGGDPAHAYPHVGWFKPPPGWPSQLPITTGDPLHGIAGTTCAAFDPDVPATFTGMGIDRHPGKQEN